MNSHKKEEILDILSTYLGDHSDHGNDESSFYCPFCHHHKKKLAINIETQAFHCWVCNTRGKSLFTLLKKLGADKSDFIRLEKIVDKKTYKRVDDEVEIIFNLPSEFISIYEAKPTYELKHAIKYLKQRGITKDDIIKYNIGYCEDGMYKGYIIIPSYSKNGKLNYFVARSYHNSPMKYKNPKISKDTILFENMISWDLPIILTEGVFDAIAIKRNVIPLLGKSMQNEVYNAILKNKVEEVYVVLDADAKENALDIVHKLNSNGVKTYFVRLADLDPADLGFNSIQHIIKQTDKTDFTDLIKLKLG